MGQGFHDGGGRGGSPTDRQDRACSRSLGTPDFLARRGSSENFCVTSLYGSGTEAKRIQTSNVDLRTTRLSRWDVSAVSSTLKPSNLSTWLSHLHLHPHFRIHENLPLSMRLPTIRTLLVYPQCSRRSGQVASSSALHTRHLELHWPGQWGVPVKALTKLPPICPSIGPAISLSH